MSDTKREISIGQFNDGSDKPYETCVTHINDDRLVIVARDHQTAQEAFDFCAEHYPGEPVTVDIRP